MGMKWNRSHTGKRTRLKQKVANSVLRRSEAAMNKTNFTACEMSVLQLWLFKQFGVTDVIGSYETKTRSNSECHVNYVSKH